MGSDTYPRHLVKVRGSFFWHPSATARREGYVNKALGKDEVFAIREAVRLNAEWDKWRKSLERLQRKAREQEQAHITVYPPGSVGEAFNRVMAIRAKNRADKGIVWDREQRARDEWPRAWAWLGPQFGDSKPGSILTEELMALRKKISDRVSPGEGYRVIKIWRALWKKLPNLGPAYRGIHKDQDPSLAFENSQPDGRHEIWELDEVLEFVQTAWNDGYYGFAALLAVVWDSMFSPVDVRKLKCGQRKRDGIGSYFDTKRAKTGRETAGTLTPWSEKILDAYLAKLAAQGVTLDDTSPIFWTRGGVATDKGGRPWPPRPYTKDRLGIDFREIRAKVFGEDEDRQLQDFRRSGVAEAETGGTDLADLSSKMSNTMNRSSQLQKAYRGVNLPAIRRVDAARAKGRRPRLVKPDADDAGR